MFKIRWLNVFLSSKSIFTVSAITMQRKRIKKLTNNQRSMRIWRAVRGEGSISFVYESIILKYSIKGKLTCIGRTIKATIIIITTSNLVGQISGTTSPNPTVEKVTMQK